MIALIKYIISILRILIAIQLIHFLLIFTLLHN